ncbi:MAG: hypothetical protein IJW40_08980 [Clostridia bacterium]|nr:hypothetical protein [Clostridia bacterium]
MITHKNSEKNASSQNHGRGIYSSIYKRRLAFFFAVVLLMGALFSCTEEPIVASDLNFVSPDGYSIYSVVYSESTATEEIVTAAKELRDTLEIILGCEVALTDDHVSLGTDYAYEILVGDVQRTVIPTVLENLEEDEYTVRVTGHKIILLGEDNRATIEAIDYFMQDVLSCSGVETAKENRYLSISQSYRYNAFHTPPRTHVLKTDTAIPVSPYLPVELLLVDVPGNTADALTLATLQGLAAAMSGEQILLNTETAQRDAALLTAALPDGYDATLYETDAYGQVWTLESLLTYFAPRLQGYILCDDDLGSESASVAISMANQLCAVVLTEENQQLAKTAGLSCVFDATSADMTWFYDSPYFTQINRTVAIEQSAALAPRLIDYAVMTGALFASYNGDDGYLHAQMFRYLDDGAVVLGENDVLGKYRTVTTLSAINATYIPARQACNLSTLSGFARDGITLEDEFTESSSTQNAANETGKHTVCLVMTDGESMEWMLDEFSTSSSWYGSAKRGSFAMNWGIPATLGELANPILTSLAATRTAADGFVIQLSGLGYTFPSLWRTDALTLMAQKLGETMQDMGVSYLQVADDGAMNSEVLLPLASLDAVKGMIYTDYNYADMNGSIVWVGDTPVVTASYRLWAGLHEGSIEYVAESVNSAATDPSGENAYSIIMVHAWSGLDGSGRLVSGGNTMDAVAALVAAFDESVEVVGVEEFFSRIRSNLSPDASVQGDGK